jgi:hypothetical protein
MRLDSGNSMVGLVRNGKCDRDFSLVLFVGP